MKKITFYLMLVVCFLGTMSCASKKAAQQSKSSNKADVDGFVEIKQSPIQKEAANPLKGEIRGYGQAISPNEQAAINQAKAFARADIQAQVEAFVKYAIDIYNQTTTVSENQHFDQSARENVTTVAKGAVQAVEVKSRILYNPQTKQYKAEVCSKFDKAGIINAIEEQNQRILKNREKFLEDIQGVWDEYDRSKGRKNQAEYENEMEQQNLDRQNARDIEVINAIGQANASVEAQRQQASASQAIYFYSAQGTNYGPYTILQLINFVQNGIINPQTSVWYEGLANWISAYELPELKSVFPQTSTSGSVPPPPAI